MLLKPACICCCGGGGGGGATCCWGPFIPIWAMKCTAFALPCSSARRTDIGWDAPSGITLFSADIASCASSRLLYLHRRTGRTMNVGVCVCGEWWNWFHVMKKSRKNEGISMNWLKVNWIYVAMWRDEVSLDRLQFCIYIKTFFFVQKYISSEVSHQLAVHATYRTNATPLGRPVSLSRKIFFCTMEPYLPKIVSNWSSVIVRGRLVTYRLVSLIDSPPGRAYET